MLGKGKDLDQRSLLTQCSAVLITDAIEVTFVADAHLRVIARCLRSVPQNLEELLANHLAVACFRGLLNKSDHFTVALTFVLRDAFNDLLAEAWNHHSLGALSNTVTNFEDL